MNHNLIIWLSDQFGDVIKSCKIDAIYELEDGGVQFKHHGKKFPYTNMLEITEAVAKLNKVTYQGYTIITTNGSSYIYMGDELMGCTHGGVAENSKDKAIERVKTGRLKAA